MEFPGARGTGGVVEGDAVGVREERGFFVGGANFGGRGGGRDVESLVVVWERHLGDEYGCLVGLVKLELWSWEARLLCVFCEY